MIIKSSFSFCVGALLLTAVNVTSYNLENPGDSTLIGQLIERVSALEERDAIQQKLIVDLQNEVSDQRKDMGRMKQSLAARDRRIWSLLHSMRRQETLENPEKQAEVSETSKRSGDDQPFKQKGSTLRRIRQSDIVITVAFSAAVSKTLSHLGIHQNIVFDHVFTNVGNGYNAHHGVFLAPVAGTYVFSTTIYVTNNHLIWCQIVLNGAHTSTVYTQALNSVDATSSQTIILQLRPGDDVAIQLLKDTVEIFGSGKFYSTFSGFLLI